MKKSIYSILIILAIFLITLFVPNTVRATLENVWSKTYQDAFSEVIETSNGKYIAVGNDNNNDATFVVYNSDGTIELEKTYGGTGVERFDNVIETSDGNYIAVGYTNSAAIPTTDGNSIQTSGDNDGLIVKFDKNGNVLWANVFGGANREFFYSAVETLDKGYIIACDSRSSEIATNGDGDIVLIKYDQNGVFKWSKNYGGDDFERLNSVIKTNDGNYVGVGWSSSASIATQGYSDGIIMKFDEDGNTIWKHSYGTEGFEYFNNVVETSNGNLIVVGDSSKNPCGIIVKYDTNGTMVGQVKHVDNTRVFYSIDETSDGGYITSGMTYKNNAANGQIIKYNSAGEIEENKICENFESILSVIETSDQSYIAIGSKVQNEQGKYIAAIAKYKISKEDNKEQDQDTDIKEDDKLDDNNDDKINDDKTNQTTEIKDKGEKDTTPKTGNNLLIQMVLKTLLVLFISIGIFVKLKIK